MTIGKLTLADSPSVLARSGVIARSCQLPRGNLDCYLPADTGAYAHPKFADYFSHLFILKDRPARSVNLHPVAESGSDHAVGRIHLQRLCRQEFGS